jgi:hypothetical protein
MDKQEILEIIKQSAKEQAVSLEEISIAYGEGLAQFNNSGIVFSRDMAPSAPVVPKEDALTRRMNFSDILYYVGAFIVFLGITVLLWQNWDELNSFARILATFGAALAAYVTGVLLSRQEKYESVGLAFHFIAALVFPIGIMVIFDSADIEVGTSGIQSWVSIILFSAYLASYWVFRKNVFIIFSIIFGTWFFYAFCNFLFGEIDDFDKIFEYLTLAIGICYIFLGYYFSKIDDKKGLKGFLYGFGSLFLLGSTLALGGWSPNQNSFWEIIYPGLIFGMIFLGIYLKSRGMLILSIIYLMIYILKITSEYFTGSLGWPLSLVIVGLALIGSGYYAFYLNKKYLTGN